jgi:muramoyltetrapeptide carboxypeptidase LdcA involved in peptidoglycan recycling
MKKVAIVACSNPRTILWKNQKDKLIDFFKENNYEVIMSKYIYESNNALDRSGEKRANELMNFFNDFKIEEIYDISGGDMANEILDYIDFDIIKNSSATFWGYSDLTTIINAIYTKINKPSVLYQVRNLIDEEYKDILQKRFINRDKLFDLNYEFIQGSKINGIVVGGNIRCFLKLSGTPYYPDMNNKVLVLESLGGQVPQMITYLSQLKSQGVFNKINGIILGTFTEMEKEKCSPDMVTLVKHFVPKDLPIVKTKEIGHNKDAKAIWIGKEILIEK